MYVHVHLAYHLFFFILGLGWPFINFSGGFDLPVLLRIIGSWSCLRSTINPGLTIICSSSVFMSTSFCADPFVLDCSSSSDSSPSLSRSSNSSLSCSPSSPLSCSSSSSISTSSFSSSGFSSIMSGSFTTTGAITEISFLKLWVYWKLSSGWLNSCCVSSANFVICFILIFWHLQVVSDYNGLLCLIYHRRLSIDIIY